MTADRSYGALGATQQNFHIKCNMRGYLHEKLCSVPCRNAPSYFIRGHAILMRSDPRSSMVVREERSKSLSWSRFSADYPV
jgi:hypothetical protein